MGLSESTIEVLKGAKRGKACRFVLLYAGTAPVQLVAYRKGSPDKYVREAKEAGTGKIASGVIKGEGDELRLQLSRADGYDKAPVTTMALRSFLNDGGFKCKPLVEIVESLGPVLDSDDPLVRRFLELQNAALAAADLQPDRAAEINRACLALGKMLEQDSSAPAVPEALAALERLVSPAAAVGSVGSADSPASPSPKPDTVDELERFKTRFTELIKAATPLVAQIGDRLKELAAEAKASAGKSDWTAANEALGSLAKLIESAQRVQALRAATGVDIPPDAPVLSPDDLAAAHAGVESLRERAAQLEQIMRANDQQILLGQLSPVADRIQEGTEESLSDAARTLTRLEAESQRLITEAELSAGESELGPPKGVVVYQKTRLAWDGVVKRAKLEIEAFKRAAAEEMKQDPDLAAEIGCLGRLDELLDDVAEGIADALDAAANATNPTDLRRAHQAAREILRRRSEEIALREEFALLSDNEVAPSQVRQLLIDSLATLDKAMGA